MKLLLHRQTLLRFTFGALLLSALFPISRLRAAPPAASNAPSQNSALWGERGEKWTPNGRLPDFSYAGYHRGEQPLPDVAQAANVKDFGAVGDGVADDTQAIQAAINATRRGAVFVPAGRYKITDFIRIEKSGLVLRGAGPDKSILWFPRGLDEIHPKEGHTSTGSPASGYSFDGAFVTLEGDYGAKPLAKIVGTARRGDSAVEVEQNVGLKAGQAVLVTVQEDAAQSLKTYLYGGDPGDIAKGKPLETKMVMRVVEIKGNRVQFDRPLRFETRAAWQPEIRSFVPTVTESGVENLRFEFPNNRYRGHFKENGANALELRQVNNCWVRNVAVHNGDMGVNMVACGNTVDGITFTADPERGIRAEGVEQCTGHHAIQCKHAEDNLVTRFEVRASFCHDLSVENAAGNVYAAGSGANLNFDHHKDTPYENLYTDIDVGAGTRLWRSGGGASLGREAAGWETFWNIRAARDLTAPPASWGVPSLNFVGLKTAKPSETDPNGTWFEAVSPANLQPSDLHAAQLQKRLEAVQAKSK